jgi:prolyl 4-hydroxylase
MPEMNADWQNWVEENLLRGIPEQELIQILLEHQFEKMVAYKTVIAMAEKIEQVPDTDLSLESTVSQFQRQAPCNGIGKPWSVIIGLQKPVIQVYSNVLSSEECDQLIEISRSKLTQSTTVDNESGAALPHEHRTSRGTFFQLKENAFIQSIDERLSEIMNLPLENGEGLQVLNYQTNGEYKPHFDYFPEEHAGSSVHIKKGGQRVATLILYLNDVEEGGETIFPEIGLSVTPVKGCAVYFSYFHQGQVDPLTLHGGAPVIQGEKWIATKWMRESSSVVHTQCP